MREWAVSSPPFFSLSTAPNQTLREHSRVVVARATKYKINKLKGAVREGPIKGILTPRKDCSLHQKGLPSIDIDLDKNSVKIDGLYQGPQEHHKDKVMQKCCHGSAAILRPSQLVTYQKRDQSTRPCQAKLEEKLHLDLTTQAPGKQSKTKWLLCTSLTCWRWMLATEAKHFSMLFIRAWDSIPTGSKERERWCISFIKGVPPEMLPATPFLKKKKKT